MMCYNMSFMDIIEKLKEYRLENRLSQEKLSKLLNVSFATVNRWFTGKYKPSDIQIYHIKKLLKIK